MNGSESTEQTETLAKENASFGMDSVRSGKKVQKRKMTNRKQHFVPRHYLEQFGIAGTDLIRIALLEPFKIVPPGAISAQCQKDYFYEEEATDELVTSIENDLLPAFRGVLEKESFNSEELVALRFLAVVIHLRTKKAVEIEKVFHRRMAYDHLMKAVAKGRLRRPPEGFGPHQIDFGGVPASLLKEANLLWLEMQTLSLKLLKAEAGASFVTSDHPAVALNQSFMEAEPHRSFAGFSRSGFQLVLPLSSTLCLFFYDAKVYKVGSRRLDRVEIEKSDVEIVNSLQVQNADKCLYFPDTFSHFEVESLVRCYTHLRTPIEKTIQTIQAQDGSEILHMRNPSVRILTPWNFCRSKRHPSIGHDCYRNPAWSEFSKHTIEEMRRDPQDSDIFRVMEKILGQKIGSREADS